LNRNLHCFFLFYGQLLFTIGKCDRWHDAI
jgi:hypothetical protein